MFDTFSECTQYFSENTELFLNCVSYITLHGRMTADYKCERT